MGISYIMFTEYKHNGKWYCVNPYAINVETGEYKLIPTLHNHASRRFESVYNELKDLGSQVNINDLSENLRAALNDWGLESEKTIYAVDYDDIDQQCKKKPIEYSAFALRSEIRDFENGLEDDIYDYVSAAEYRVMDRELKKAYQYYEWNQRFGWFEYFKKILKAMAEHLLNFETANNIYQENGEHRLIMFIH